jgi:SpoVK/Ycf46/Vps4 family AAA+-type ATPase
LEDVRLTISALCRAVNGKAPRPEQCTSDEFCRDLVNADVDVDALLSKVAGAGAAPRFSICLFGPPGTGKSALARELARKMGLEHIQKRYSDIASKWLGESEQNIARAFEEAIESNAVLIFDEADSLLGDRQRAQHSWEISQVNEMLTWMESHPLPFVCSTNLMTHLDAASLRRFTFKIRFDYLRPEQVRTAFQHFFGLLPSEPLAGLNRLTPSDFTVVRGKAKILGTIGNAAELVEMLRSEQAAKPDFVRPIGFGVT